MSGRYRKLTDSSGTTIWPVTTSSAVVKEDVRVSIDHFLREYNLCSIWKDEVFNLSSALERLTGLGVRFQKGDRIIFDDSTEINVWAFDGNNWKKQATSSIEIIDEVLPDDERLVTSNGIYIAIDNLTQLIEENKNEIKKVESVTEIALNDLKKTQLKGQKRIEDLEIGYEAIYDDIEKLDSNAADEIKKVDTRVTNLTEKVDKVEEVTENALIDLNSRLSNINSLTYSDIDNII